MLRLHQPKGTGRAQSRAVESASPHRPDTFTVERTSITRISFIQFPAVRISGFCILEKLSPYLHTIDANMTHPGAHSLTSQTTGSVWGHQELITLPPCGAECAHQAVGVGPGREWLFLVTHPSLARTGPRWSPSPICHSLDVTSQQTQHSLTPDLAYTTCLLKICAHLLLLPSFHAQPQSLSLQLRHFHRLPDEHGENPQNWPVHIW